MFRLSLFLGSILAILGWIGSVWYFNWIEKTWETIITPSDITIEISTGQYFWNLASWYPDFPLDRLAYTLWLRANAPQTVLQIGTYHIPEGTTLNTLVHKLLSKPQQDYVSVRILPGWSLVDIRDFFEKEYAFTRSSFDMMHDSVLANLRLQFSFLSSVSSLEWMIFPDTYHMSRNFSLTDFFEMSFRTWYERIYLPHLASRSDWYDMVTLASIVEREEKNPQERPTVAGILLQRIDIWMPIGTDITVCYQEKILHTECHTFVNNYYASSLEKRKNLWYRYDTRMFSWLPPSPIGSITRDSLEAVLHPNPTEYLYYLHDSLGEIHYGSTLEQHNRNKQRFLQ